MHAGCLLRFSPITSKCLGVFLSAFSQLVSETRSALAEKSKSLNSCNSNNETSGFFLLGSKFTRPLAFIYGERHFLHI